jgi:hypothetical protein
MGQRSLTQAALTHASSEGKYHGEEPKEIEPRSPQTKGRKAQKAKRVKPVNKGQSSGSGDKKLRR